MYILWAFFGCFVFVFTLSKIIHKMSKRANPFIEDYIPQCKVHVGMKQFNNNNDRLKKVYEKTLDLLFKGAKKNVEVNNPTSCDSSTIKRDNMKQLFIGKDGTLSHSGQVMYNKTKESIKYCKCGGQGECPCAYCESTLCVSCFHRCIKCEAFYCTHCILIGLEGTEVCVSCYG